MIPAPFANILSYRGERSCWRRRGLSSGRLRVWSTVSTLIPRTVMSVAGPSTLRAEMGTPNSRQMEGGV